MSYRVLTLIALTPSFGNIFRTEYRVMYEPKRTDIQFYVSGFAVQQLTYGYQLACF